MFAPEFDVIDPRFRALIYGCVAVETLFAGCRFGEGPVYFPAGRYLVFSDIPNDRLMRWDETTGAVSVFRHPSGYANGNAMDRQGRLLTCEHQGRRVTRTGHDGRVVTLAGAYKGRKLNSPNDVIVKSDNSVWFTDPSYGIDSHYEGELAEKEQDGCYVFRLDPARGELTVATGDMVQPNGLAFGPDERLLYIVDSGVSHMPDGPRHMRRFTVTEAGGLSGGELFATCPLGIFDGIDVDHCGNVWASAADGVYCYAPDGDLIGRILIPEVVSNLTFGGIKRNRLFITGATGVYAVYLKTLGVPLSTD